MCIPLGRLEAAYGRNHIQLWLSHQSVHKWVNTLGYYAKKKKRQSKSSHVSAFMVTAALFNGAKEWLPVKSPRGRHVRVRDNDE